MIDAVSLTDLLKIKTIFSSRSVKFPSLKRMIYMLLGLRISYGYLAGSFRALTVSTVGIHNSIYYPENAQFYISYLLEIIVSDSGRKKATCRLHDKFLIKNDP